MTSSRKCLMFLLLAVANSESQGRSDTEVLANPIRKVVTMLQSMQAKVQEEGEKEAALYEKFMCYCKTAGGDLTASIAAAETSISDLSTKIKTSEEEKVQLESDLQQAQVDREAAKKAMAEATAIREKEAAVFAALKADLDANIAAIAKAVSSLEKGMAGSFLQTTAAQVLKRLVLGGHSSLADDDREDLLSFISSGQSGQYAPSSGSIVGILKQMGDEMDKNLSEATEAEDGAIKNYESLMAAKKKEVLALTKAIETKLARVGDLGVAIAQMKNDLGDTEAALVADKEFLANLDSGCEKKKAEWEVIVKTRAEELAALAETIKVLNDDDALDLFKRTLPSASLMQLDVGMAKLRRQALATIEPLLKASRSHHFNLEFVALALQGKKIGFEKVIKMIDEMVATLKTEQKDDDNKKEYCTVQLDKADDKKKGLERSVSDLEAAIASAKDGIAKTAEEIAALKAGIVELDKMVAEATEQRKQENEDFKELMAADTAAKDLLAYAKNRLNKFYNPKLYKPAPKTELSREDRIVENMSGTAAPTQAPGGIAGTGIAVFSQVVQHAFQHVAPPPPPETFGAYVKKSEDSMGVMAMIDLLIKDVEKEMTEAETEESDAQADYEVSMTDSAAKRTADSNSLNEKELIKADLEASVETKTEAKASATNELMSTVKYISSLHSECDWLIKYYDVRKEARASEIDALGKAKAVLSGADFSFVQTHVHGFLGKA